MCKVNINMQKLCLVQKSNSKLPGKKSRKDLEDLFDLKTGSR